MQQAKPAENGDRYKRDGFVSSMALVSKPEASAHRNNLEPIDAERGTLHCLSKFHTLLTFAAETATPVRGLDQFNHYKFDTFAKRDMPPQSLASHVELEKLRKQTWDNA